MDAATTRPKFAPLFDNVQLAGAGIDWITCTATSPAGRSNLTRLWAKYSAQESRKGAATKKSAFQGFQGAGCGAVFFGRREEVLLFRVSSSLADEVFPELDHQEVKLTRIDLQLTFRLAAYNGRIAEELADRRERARQDPAAPLVPSQSLLKGFGRGDTLTIGSRSSPRYGRIYDKQKESATEAYERCWRYEIEYKRVMAPKVAQWLAGQPDRAAAIVGAVKGEFEGWGIECPTNAAPARVAGSIGRRTFDTDRALAWLRSQVAPSVEKLLGTVGPFDILEALGLTGPELKPSPLENIDPDEAKYRNDWEKQVLAPYAERRS